MVKGFRGGRGLHMREVAPGAAEHGEGDARGADGAFVDNITGVGAEEALFFCLGEKLEHMILSMAEIQSDVPS